MLKAWLNEVIRNEHYVPGDLAFIFCSDDFLLEMNRKFLNHDYFTDIITFDYTEQKVIGGDLYISIDRVSENADSLGFPFEFELHRVMVHGTLHLLGYLDKSKADLKIMRKKEDFYLERRNPELKNLS